MERAATFDLGADERARGLAVARSRRVAVFVAARAAEEGIGATLRRIPPELARELARVYVIDDSDTGATARAARELRRELPQLEVFTTPWRQGQGGLQKLGYRYAVRERFDLVAVLRGDGRHAPELLPRLLAPFADDSIAAVIGARWTAAVRGGAPGWKRLANRAMTRVGSRLLGASFADLFSGYRVYRVDSLAELPLEHADDGYAFEVEALVQLLQRGARIAWVPVPPFHGDELGVLGGARAALACLWSLAHARATRLYLAWHPKFDAEPGAPIYRFTSAPTSLHQFVLRSELAPGERVLELGAGQGELGAELARRGAHVVSLDARRPVRATPQPFLELDLDGEFVADALEALGGRAERVIALDVLEHLADPERGARMVQRCLAPGGRLVASTGNVAYLPLRLALLAGRFNYGKLGILDMTHSRLFTARSFRRLFATNGFRVERVRGFGPPIEDMIGRGPLLIALDRAAALLARIWPALFGYQLLVETTRVDDLDDMLARTLESEPGEVERAAP